MSLTTTDLLGPLTTVWTPPTACLATATYNPNAIWAPNAKSSLSPAVLLGATGQAVDLVCYPPRYTANHIYSPALCPSGWTSACEPAEGSKTGLIASPTTGAQCCPTGLRCSGINWCVQDPKPTVRPVWSLYTDKYGIEGVMTSAAFPTNKVFAKPIFVAYQSSDKRLLASASKAAASSGSAQPTAAASSGTSLSGGTVAGIAIGSAVGGILIATISTFILLRFCFGYRRAPKRSRKSGPHELDSSVRGLASQQDEQHYHWGNSATELDSAGKTELASPGNTRNELPLREDTLPDRAELADQKDFKR